MLWESASNHHSHSSLSYSQVGNPS
jgi:hypothetical protein